MSTENCLIDDNGVVNFEHRIIGSDSYKLTDRLFYNFRNQIFLAFGETSGQKAVIKYFSKADDFLKEKEIQELLLSYGGHKNILLASEFLEEQKIMISPYAKGGSLRNRQRWGGNLNFSQMKAVASGVLDALQYMHEHDIVHRDVKGDNIVFDGRALGNNPKILDFELAEHLRFYQGEEPELGDRVVGTFHYMAPEVWKGGEKLCRDPRSDLYSAGITFFHQLTGRFPFDGNPHEIMKGHLERPVPDIRQYLPEIPADAQEIFEKALAKDLNSRYQTAAELKNALGQVKE